MFMLVGTAGAGVAVRVRVAVLMRGMIVGMLGGGLSQVVCQPRRRTAQRERCPWRDHAKQIEQGDKPPRSGPVLLR